MTLRYFSRAAYRAFTTAKNGPTLYDLCDPLLAGSGEGNPHLRKFYRKVLANLALRLLLSAPVCLNCVMKPAFRRLAPPSALRETTRRPIGPPSAHLWPHCSTRFRGNMA